MKKFKNHGLLVTLGIFALIAFFPSIIINTLNWHWTFRGGTFAYYINLLFIFIPYLVAFSSKRDWHFTIAILNTLFLFFVLDSYNGQGTGTIDNQLLVLLFYLIYFIVLLSLFGFWNKTNNFDKDGETSYVNPLNVEKGYKWTYLNKIKKLFEENREGKLYIDNFRTDRDIPGKRKAEQTQIYFNPLDTTKTILTIGKMGSGKTEFFNSILSQNNNFNFYNREILHDIKGDFTQKFYNEDTDFVFNPYDNRGCAWDIWEDMKKSEALVMSFVTNLIEYHMQEKDFFSSSGAKILTEFFIKTHYSNMNTSSSEKWGIFLNEINKYEAECGEDKTKASIFANIELAVEVFKMFYWQSLQTKLKTFTINKFLNSNGRLILLNNASYSKKLYPVFTGFLAMIIEMMLSKEDTNNDLTLMLLDEYLSIKFDDDIRLKMQTQIRSKGGCLLIGVQYLDMHNQKAKQLLDSSKYATLVFNTVDGETIKHLCNAYGTVHYEKTKKSRSSSSEKYGSGTTTYSTEDKQENFLTPKHIQSMPEYHHLTLLPEKEVFYLGYTPLVKIRKINNSFDKKDLSDYYNFIYNKISRKSIKSFEAEHDYTLAQKRKIYLEFTKIDENSKDYVKLIDAFLYEYNLIKVNLNDFFKDVLKN